MQLIAWKDRDSRLLVDNEEIQCLEILSGLNEDAESIYELHTDDSPSTHSGSAWKELVLSPSRPTIQMQLKNAVQKCELVYADKPTSAQSS